MKKLEKINNYIVVTDTVMGVIDFEYPAANIIAMAKSKVIELLSFNENLKRYIPLVFTKATGSVELTAGASGSVDGITVNSIQIMSGAEAFATDLPTTASNVAANINAFTSTPNYTAVANGAIVTITASVAGVGENTNAVVSSVTTITKTDTNMAGGTSSVAKTGDVGFDDEAEVRTFLRTNTGA